MSKPVVSRLMKHLSRDDEPATQLTVPIGPAVLDLLDVAYRARRPVLLEGATGIGKSQIVGEFAAVSGMSMVVLDLSLLEPPDLVGLPVIREGRTHYASPAELPTTGRGILMLEELNRAEIPVMQPALQLLSARRLHAYELPPGWMCVAAVNPDDGDYQVNRLDPALRSRFLQLSVCSDREAWLRWAVRHNVHPVILQIVRGHLDVFEHASPRSWAYASDLLSVLGPEEMRKRDLVRTVLRGYLPSAWSLLVTDALVQYPETPSLDVETLLSPRGPAALAALVEHLDAAKRIDAVTMVASKLRHLLAGDAVAMAIMGGRVTLEDLERLVSSLPGDLREQCLETAVESPVGDALLRTLHINLAAVAETYARSALRTSVREWRRSAQMHRVRLVVAGVVRSLRDASDEIDEAQRSQLHLLAEDADGAALDLERWLSASSPRREGT
jgi:MoxR-like ATPase